MTETLVITFVGPDRPGIVEALARVVASQHGNWEGSRSASFAGRFAGILQVRVSGDSADALVAGLRALPGIQILIERGGEGQPKGRSLRFEVTGADREGIVRQVAAALAQFDVNIEELETDRTDAPMSGGAVFRAMAKVTVPDGVRLDTVVEAVERLADDLVVEFHAPGDGAAG